MGAAIKKLMKKLVKTSRRAGKKYGKALKWQAIGQGGAAIAGGIDKAVDRYRQNQMGDRMGAALGIDPSLARGLTPGMLTELALAKQQRDRGVASVKSLLSRSKSFKDFGDVEGLTPGDAVRLRIEEMRDARGGSGGGDPLFDIDVKSGSVYEKAGLPVGKSRIPGSTLTAGVNQNALSGRSEATIASREQVANAKMKLDAMLANQKITSDEHKNAVSALASMTSAMAIDPDQQLVDDLLSTVRGHKSTPVEAPVIDMSRAPSGQPPQGQPPQAEPQMYEPPNSANYDRLLQKYGPLDAAPTQQPTGKQTISMQEVEAEWKAGKGGGNSLDDYRSFLTQQGYVIR